MPIFNKSMPLNLLASILIINIAPAHGSSAGAQFVLENCTSCHTLAQPKKETLQTYVAKKGPDLYYAGSKYRKAWMVKWLQNPQRIRPGGMFFGNHTEVTNEGDVIKESSLPNPVHTTLSKHQAQDSAAYLMTLTAKSDLLTRENYTPKKISKRMGAMNFSKFKGCSSCHRDQPDLGGISGPELYTAAERLQERFLSSYIRNPQAWERKSLMPNRHLPDKEVYKLVDYLKLLEVK
jgi:mono/diheme cytochrome c family protein